MTPHGTGLLFLSTGSKMIHRKPEISLEAICDQMGRTPPWIPGIGLRGDGYKCNFYQKD